MASDAGVVPPLGPVDTIAQVFVACVLSVALYNVLELHLSLFFTFKSFKGLYFYSCLAATWGILLCAIGFLLKTYLPISAASPYLAISFIIVGWYGMVTGQSMVLYSRLHLVLYNVNRLRFVLSMIIFDAVICHIPITVLMFGANSPNPDPFLLPYSIYEKFQVTVFFLQELIISGLYIWETFKLLQVEGEVPSKASRRMLRHLMLVMAVVVALDVTILALEYGGFYQYQTSYKILVYSVKLKFEFSILNRLVELVRTRSDRPLTGPES